MHFSQHSSDYDEEESCIEEIKVNETTVVHEIGEEDVAKFESVQYLISFKEDDSNTSESKHDIEISKIENGKKKNFECKKC